MKTRDEQNMGVSAFFPFAAPPQLETKVQLLGQHLAQRRRRDWGRPRRACPQQGHGVGQQTGDPTKGQAVQIISVQSKLMFVVRLSGFDPRAALIKEPLRHLAVGGDGSIKNLMLTGRVRELLGTGALLPAPPAERVGVPHPKPVKLITQLQPQPVQPLALLATHTNGGYQKHQAHSCQAATW